MCSWGVVRPRRRIDIKSKTRRSPYSGPRQPWPRLTACKTWNVKCSASAGFTSCPRNAAVKEVGRGASRGCGGSQGCVGWRVVHPDRLRPAEMSSLRPLVILCSIKIITMSKHDNAQHKSGRLYRIIDDRPKIAESRISTGKMRYRGSPD